MDFARINRYIFRVSEEDNRVIKIPNKEPKCHAFHEKASPGPAGAATPGIAGASASGIIGKHQHLRSSERMRLGSLDCLHASVNRRKGSLNPRRLCLWSNGIWDRLIKVIYNPQSIRWVAPDALRLCLEAKFNNETERQEEGVHTLTIAE